MRTNSRNIPLQGLLAQHFHRGLFLLQFFLSCSERNIRYQDDLRCGDRLTAARDWDGSLTVSEVVEISCVLSLLFRGAEVPFSELRNVHRWREHMSATN